MIIQHSSFQFVVLEVVKVCEVAGMVGLSLGEQCFIEGGIAQDLRCDGRKRFTCRPILVETGVIPQVTMLS